MTEIQPVDRERFRATYLRSVSEVVAFWTPAMQEEIARHNQGWRVGVTDFGGYLRNSELRFWNAYEALCRGSSGSRVCDIGGFFGVFPLTLKRLGFEMAMTESLQYYSDSFTDLFDFLRGQGVEIIDHDPFSGKPAPGAVFDAVTVLAVLEHYPHSLESFMRAVKAMVKPHGHIYIEVSNIAYWPRRWGLMRGRSPLVPIEEIFRSATPFLGHHHEFTHRELCALADLTELDVVESRHFNYSFQGPLHMRLISDLPLTLASMQPDMRECLAILTRVRTRREAS